MTNILSKQTYVYGFDCELITLKVIEYRIVYGTRVLYEYTRLSLGLDSISFNVRRTRKMSIQNENYFVLNENSVEEKPCINRESKSNELTIQFYSCYDISMKFLEVVTPPSIYHGCSTRKTFWEEKFTGKENLFLAVNMKNCGRRMLGNIRRSRLVTSISHWTSHKSLTV